MARLDKYFPPDKGEDSVNINQQIDIDKLIESVSLSIENRMQELFNKMKNESEEKNNENFKQEQGINKSGDISANEESGNNDN